MTIQMKATEQQFPLVLLITQYKVVHDVTFVSVDDGLKRHHLIKIYTSTLAVRLLPCRYPVVSIQSRFDTSPFDTHLRLSIGHSLLYLGYCHQCNIVVIL